MTDTRTGPSFRFGEVVDVNAFGRWYTGQIVKLSDKRATVRYTSGTGVTREKAVGPGLVRKHGRGPGLECTGPEIALYVPTAEDKVRNRRNGDLRRFYNDCRHVKRAIGYAIVAKPEWAEWSDICAVGAAVRLAHNARELGLLS